jgi:hypothetical protein
MDVLFALRTEFLFTPTFARPHTRASSKSLFPAFLAHPHTQKHTRFRPLGAPLGKRNDPGSPSST